MAKQKQNEKPQAQPQGNIVEALVESPEVALGQAELFLKKQKRLLIAVGTGLVLLVGGFMFYRYLKNNQQEGALNELFAAEVFFTMDSTRLVLEGNGNYLGVQQIATEFPLADVKALTHFYAGVSLMKEGNYEAAITELKQFDGDDKLVQARAYALIGDAHVELQQWQDAIKAYEKAIKHAPNEYFTPTYVMKKALVHEQIGDWKGAASSYDIILRRYANSQYINDAKKYKARAEQLGSTPSN